ncbi:2-hydroxyacid dehydrogenase [Coralloluteibacterium thermophilus]|uniref:2-hydroxyacid dehydrogenase n=1 Tax=Coralloluteibacterium thermophilum TaxID=2707049 RepID=A0ABV9NG45_9GAMM
MPTTTTVFLDRASLDLGDLDLAGLHAAAGDLVLHDATAPEAVAGRLAGAEVVLSNKVPIAAETFAACPALRLVLVVATGTNNVDLDAARRHGVTVCNGRGYGTTAVAQHTMMLILALHTRFLDYQRDVRAGAWQRAPQFCLMHHPVEELAGRTLGILGHGELGQAVGRLAEAFGMRVRIGRIPGRPDRPGYVPFETLLAEADVVSLHCPLTEATRNLIDADALARMKPGAFLVNTGRGGLVDEAALADALRRGAIAGAGVDVLTEEPPRRGNVLLADDIPNLVVTPHNAWASRQARQRLLNQTVENLRAWRAGRPVRVVA